MAPKLQSTHVLQEQRARMVQAVRATYRDMFEGGHVTASQLSALQVVPVAWWHGVLCKLSLTQQAAAV